MYNFVKNLVMAGDTTIADYIKQVKFVQDNLFDETRSIIEDDYVTEMILDLNREQLSQNELPDGSEIGTYAQSYFEFDGYSGFPSFPKKEDNPFNFNWSGDYFRSLYIQFNSQSQISIMSNDSTVKKGQLLKAYGQTAGLNEQSQYELNYKILLPEILAFVNKHL